ncbi:MAG: family 16 glycosylhydrolase [Pricia sp.]
MKKSIVFCFSVLTVSFFSCENDELPASPESADIEQPIESVEARAGTWSTVFQDGFNASSNINDKWTRTTGRPDYNSSICHYKSWFSTLETLDGKQCLRLRARKINNSEYRAGHVKSKYSYEPNNNEEYRLTASIKLLARDGNNYKGFGQTYGAWPAFWTVQENNWPTKGEIDIMEGYSKAPNSPKFASNLFYGTSSMDDLLENRLAHEYGVSEGWHTYEMRWKKSSTGYVTVYIYLDGSHIKTYNNRSDDKLRLQNFGPHNIILNLNVGADNSDIFDNSKINLFSDTSMYVDYVKLQKRNI